jgi:hypothetical protein
VYALTTRGARRTLFVRKLTAFAMTQRALYPGERESRDATKNIGSEAIKVSVAMYRFAIHSGSVEQWLHYSENTDRYFEKGKRDERPNRPFCQDSG